MKRIALLFFLLFNAIISYATHNRAGQITYVHVSGFTYEMTINTYTKLSSVAADRDTLLIKWGDGTSEYLQRVESRTVIVPDLNLKINYYVGTHTYPGYSTYVISMQDPNRSSDILNVTGDNGSVNQPFYLQDTLKILDPNFFGYNNSVTFLNPPIDFAQVGKIWIHNPNAYDPDGDSLSYTLDTPLQAQGKFVDGYYWPNEIPGSFGSPTFAIDKRTGIITWNAPEIVGLYNIAMVVHEYRNGFDMGSVERDMQIIVDSVTRQPPILIAPRDTCIVAGSSLSEIVKASDPTPGELLDLSANGGPFLVNPPLDATFTSSDQDDSVSGTFNWTTNCGQISRDPYQVVFRVREVQPDSNVVSLSTIGTLLITLLGPPPENLQAISSQKSVALSWQYPSLCDSPKIFIGYSVWRKSGCDSVDLGPCQTDLSAVGYTQLKSFIKDFTYTDNTIRPGLQFTYRVEAEFAQQTPAGTFYNFVYGLPSAPVCITINKPLPVITHVTVRNTDAVKGSILVTWSKPLANNVDTIKNPAPYKYELYRGTGFNLTNPVLINSFTANSFAELTDSSFIDSLLDTKDQPYSYRLIFYSNGINLGYSDSASSTFLVVKAGVSRHQLNLSWQSNDQWIDTSFVIYKENASGQFVQLTITKNQQFVDNTVSPDTNYCYEIEKIGSFFSASYQSPLINYSQIACATPIDTIGPCAPVLKVSDACGNPQYPYGPNANLLTWTKPADSCAPDLYKYYIYYALSSGGTFSLLDSANLANDTTYLHQGTNGNNYCYKVAGVDSSFNIGVASNIVCAANCASYHLPNTFTPNGDGKNDVFVPIPPVSGVDHVDMKIFNRWGVLVYSTTNPMINWNGKDMGSGQNSPVGVYYYVCKVYISNASGKPTLSETLNGFIQLFR
jgi:gliding motility-associated-like protein